MITDDFYSSIGIDESQRKAIKKQLDNEQRFRSALLKAGVMPSVINKIVSKSDSCKIAQMDDELLSETIKEQWAEFIKK